MTDRLDRLIDELREAIRLQRVTATTDVPIRDVYALAAWISTEERLLDDLTAFRAACAAEVRTMVLGDLREEGV